MTFSVPSRGIGGPRNRRALRGGLRRCCVRPTARFTQAADAPPPPLQPTVPTRATLPGCSFERARSDDVHPRPRPVLRRPGPYQEMASVLIQVFMIVSHGRASSGRFTATGSPSATAADALCIGGFAKAFLHGHDAELECGDLLNGVVIPEFAYLVFQMTFA